jgi:DNA-nicking Smr family endonuclease
VDFGNILDQWERQNSGANNAGKKKKAPGAGAPAEPEPQLSQKKANPVDVWLRINGIYDKDAEAEQEERSGAERRRRLRLQKPDAIIDIHGLTRDEAWEALERFFGEARRSGFEKLLIIHGKGNHSAGEAVLKRNVKEFIERCPFAGESGQEKAATGGGGATWVLLKDLSAPG